MSEKVKQYRSDRDGEMDELSLDMELTESDLPVDESWEHTYVTYQDYSELKATNNELTASNGVVKQLEAVAEAAKEFKELYEAKEANEIQPSLDRLFEALKEAGYGE